MIKRAVLCVVMLLMLSGCWEHLEHKGRWSDKHSRNHNRQETPAPVPEPATLLLLGSGLIGVAVAGKIKRRRGDKDKP